MLVSLMSHYSFQNIPVSVDKQAVEIGVADKYHKILWLNYQEFVSLVAFLEI